MPPESDDVFSSPNLDESSSNLNESSPNLNESSPNLDESSPNLDESSPNLDESSPNLDKYGRIVHPQFKYPLIGSLTALKPDFRLELEVIALEPRLKKKIPREEMIQVILKLCSEQYVTTGVLAELLQRDAETLRGQYLSKLKNAGQLEMAFPGAPTDPKQAYSGNLRSLRITESTVEEFCLEVFERQGDRFVSPGELNRAVLERAHHGGNLTGDGGRIWTGRGNLPVHGQGQGQGPGPA